jgi:hypothetical protein
VLYQGQAIASLEDNLGVRLTPGTSVPTQKLQVDLLAWIVFEVPTRLHEVQVLRAPDLAAEADYWQYQLLPHVQPDGWVCGVLGVAHALHGKYYLPCKAGMLAGMRRMPASIHQVRRCLHDALLCVEGHAQVLVAVNLLYQLDQLVDNQVIEQPLLLLLLLLCAPLLRSHNSKADDLGFHQIDRHVPVCAELGQRVQLLL